MENWERNITKGLRLGVEAGSVNKQGDCHVMAKDVSSGS